MVKKLERDPNLAGRAFGSGPPPRGPASAGVLRDVKDPGSRIRTMTSAEGKKAIEDGVVTQGMIPKLEESFGAIASGVRSVLIVGRLSPGDLTKAVNEPGSVGTVLLA